MAARPRTGAGRSRPPAARNRTPVKPAPGWQKAARGGRAVPVRGSGPARFQLPDGTRTARSPWVWRGMFFLSLIAIGLCLALFAGGKDVYGALWAVIAGGWFVISMWMWRQNLRYHKD